MKITQVKISRIIPKNGLVGFASVILDGQFLVGSIGIHKRLNKPGYRITYPSKKTNDRSVQIFHPINKELGKTLEVAIIREFKDVMGQKDVRYNHAQDKGIRF